jgi:hypothetical protein
MKNYGCAPVAATRFVEVFSAAAMYLWLLRPLTSLFLFPQLQIINFISRTGRTSSKMHVFKKRRIPNQDRQRRRRWS